MSLERESNSLFNSFSIKIIIMIKSCQDHRWATRLVFERGSIFENRDARKIIAPFPVSSKGESLDDFIVRILTR